MATSIDADCPECGSGETYFAPFRVDGAFAGGEFQCYGCGHSEVFDR
jgi:hypothetical protein